MLGFDVRAAPGARSATMRPAARLDADRRAGDITRDVRRDADGARALTEQRLRAGVEAGLGVSLDGLVPAHHGVRGVRGSFDHGLLTLRRAKAAGLATSANTQIGPQTIGYAGGNIRDTTLEAI